MANKDWRVVRVTGGGSPDTRYCVEQLTTAKIGPTLWTRCRKIAAYDMFRDREYSTEELARVAMAGFIRAAEPEVVTVMGGGDDE